ncbi:hypothetical protein [Acidovorax sp.]|uniref:hypothetical protein n=1 Tax=Acidovorax sp. TaxID=1872122 RepID=UPI00391B3FE7
MRKRNNSADAQMGQRMLGIMGCAGKSGQRALRKRKDCVRRSRELPVSSRQQLHLLDPFNLDTEGKLR